MLITERRTKIDFAHTVKHLVPCFPEAKTIHVVLDNLNTHKPASLYEAFPPNEARAIAKKLDFHYTPKHGSWLRRLPEKNVPDCAGFSVGFKARQQAHSRTM
ncbi:MAG: transposase [Candidatus Accumulibacter meliphilus]|uniref:transposase n=1 Tax=Candidatus Accumulibacter meliphilus TaxID=2211374 RepID=UPI002FC37F0C